MGPLIHMGLYEYFGKLFFEDFLIILLSRTRIKKNDGGMSVKFLRWLYNSKKDINLFV